MNAGFIEVFKNKVTNQTFDCYFFHDVDMLPTSEYYKIFCCGKQKGSDSKLFDNMLESAVKKARLLLRITLVFEA